MHACIKAAERGAPEFMIWVSVQVRRNYLCKLEHISLKMIKFLKIIAVYYR